MVDRGVVDRGVVRSRTVCLACLRVCVRHQNRARRSRISLRADRTQETVCCPWGRGQGRGRGRGYSSQPSSSMRSVMRPCHSQGRSLRKRPCSGGSNTFFLCTLLSLFPGKI